ncbi:MAG: amino acid permease C-terminal domain-containing protein, partial [Bifidobacterium criceti]|nr:amino acid permease C-terminal domain-containing protein [Bifidobacterium criceti]
IGTLSAFTLVALAIPIMRKKRPDLPRTFRVPGNPWVPILVALANFWLMLNLTVLTWIRFLVWLVVGFVIYFTYSYGHARLGTGELDAELERFDKEQRIEQVELTAKQTAEAQAKAARARRGK